ncbi:hypothetical protein GCM10007094_34940 [Pseudovibrio japonicus]|uniref:Lipoprotein n=1 Tax=Pseudovibrio japonicus TaxID=366534 RepID=A0ABQ3ENF7_9HYPH|nr:hypothetical protein [Pseudovibrio japonicus]GHB42663.1 hypothetical protein GCM10007094_34940 [Pseudovibrio japonicus]
MTALKHVKLGIIGVLLAGCAAIAADAVSQVTGQTEDGSETFNGQITAYNITLTSNRGRTCEGRPAPNPVVLTCSDGTGGSLELHARDVFIGGTGAGTIDNQNVIVNFGPFDCNGICRWPKIRGL